MQPLPDNTAEAPHVPVLPPPAFFFGVSLVAIMGALWQSAIKHRFLLHFGQSQLPHDTRITLSPSSPIC